MSLKTQLVQTLERFDEVELRQIAEYMAFLRFRTRLQLIPSPETTSLLAKALVAQKAMPMKARDDATHIATATIHHINYLLTWNCKHLANAQMQEKLVTVSSTLGYHLPRICTPYELMGEPNDVQ